MELIFIIIALLTLCYLIFTALELTFGLKTIKNLSHQADISPDKLPTVSIILSALNEEDVIERALTSMLQLNYPKLEIIAVNDRSTDRTGQILEQMKQRYPQLLVHHIQTLPDGWLGKNHALHVASQRVTGEWFLFTDADVEMQADTITKSISYVLEHNMDHLTIFEYHKRRDFWLRLTMFGNYIMYLMFFRPWRIRYSWSKKALGHGAFNLVRKSAYLASGGHRAIAMECIDDLKLGELMKRNGFRQDTVDGRDYVSRSWYNSAMEMIHGMQKNSFAYYKYRLFPAVRDITLAMLFLIWPIISLFVVDGPIFWLNLASISLMLCIAFAATRHFRLQKRFMFLYPFGIIMMLYILLNSIIRTYTNKGVIWRGTHYPLDKLRDGTTASEVN